MRFIKKTRRGKERIISIFGIEFKYHRSVKDFVLRNVFNTSFDKKVLISYLTSPFTQGLFKKHTNRLECYTAAEIFNELGYQVDVIGLDDKISSEQLKEYDIVYGFGQAFCMALTHPLVKTIYYGTGTCLRYSNIATINKIRDFYNTHGVWCPKSGRVLNNSAEMTLYFADMIIPLGNDFVANTYRVSDKKQNIKNLCCFYYDAYDIDINQKAISNIKNNFLWFGSLGCLHKGLDIVIDIFKRRPDLNLTIAGANLREEEFYKYYQDVFDGRVANIKYYDFVDIESDSFKKLMDNNIATVFPSVSEGSAPSVLNVMANGGLIPIISKSCGLDVGHYGFMFDTIDIATVEQKIDKLRDLDDDRLRKLSLQVKDETRQIYSYVNYKNNLKHIISSFLEEK